MIAYVKLDDFFSYKNDSSFLLSFLFDLDQGFLRLL